MKIRYITGQTITTVAFHATMSVSRIPVQANLVIVFQHEALDTTNSYNRGDGIFIVPEHGIYVLSWTITTGGDTWAPTYLMVNGGKRGQTMADSDDEDDYLTSTGVLVTQLSQGDHVYVQFAPSYLDGTIVSDRGQCSFSGWKIS